jgi:hypothetical protein
MFIKYNPKEKHIKCIPLIADPKSKNPQPFTSDVLILRFGTNEISDTEWAAIQPHIKAELDSGEIKAFTVPARSEKNSGKAKTLKDVPASVAKKIIENCENPAVLKKWFGQELPDEIMLMVTKRLRKLNIDLDEINEEDASDTLDDDIEPEVGTAPESDTGPSALEDEDTSESDESDDIHGDSAGSRRRGKKGAKGKKNPPSVSDESEDESDDSGSEE